MRPVVTPTEMATIDAEAPEPVGELIARAGWATARAAIDLLGRQRTYGARIAVLAGKGNNGADGRAAVPHLRRAGAHCTVFDLGVDLDATDQRSAGRPPEPFDLIIDGCYGTGLRRPFDIAGLPLEIGETPVLAIDIPSGVDGATGQIRGAAIEATSTVTFAAPKPGLLLWPGRGHVGSLTVADIGLDCSRATIDHLDADALHEWPVPAGSSHKWRRAVLVVGGGSGMTGAPRLTAMGALRAGAGYGAISVPGSVGTAGSGQPIEAVHIPSPDDWADELLGRTERFGAIVVGPGLTESETNRRAVARWWADSDRSTVFDAGALAALAASAEPAPVSSAAGAASPGLPQPRATHILTPHEGEFVRLTGAPIGDDRIAAVRWLASAVGAVIVLKGPTTVVAEPAGRVVLSTAGDARLATAGTGDVLAGIIAAGLAGGLDAFVAAGLGAELHGRAARRGHRVGLVASDLPGLVADVLAGLRPRYDR